MRLIAKFMQKEYNICKEELLLLVMIFFLLLPLLLLLIIINIKIKVGEAQILIIVRFVLVQFS
jgi:hypothetical protein